MRQIKCITAFILLLSMSLIFAQEAPAFRAEEPVLISSAGQSADVLMAKILAGKAGIEFELDKMADAKKLEGIKSLILVSGGSTKGLGAAKIDKEQEYERVEDLIKAAKKLDVKIILLHVGGKSRRGPLSDYFNQLVAENADHMVVVVSGNDDGYFTKIAKDKQIDLELPEKIVAIQDILKVIYAK
ncbi:MAG: hypothetical protein JW956_10380 [Calditrichaceae bacterium]|nr:hypothetical protein [Calditrichaceae bacterium]